MILLLRSGVSADRRKLSRSFFRWRRSAETPLRQSRRPEKAAVNAQRSRRCAQFEGVRQSRSVWTARVFSTAC